MSDMNTSQTRRDDAAGPQSQLPPPAPGQQQSGYPAGPPQPGQPGYRPPSEGSKAAPDPKLEAEHKEAMAASSIGAQVILDFNSDSGLGARGGAGGTVEENSMVRDKHLVALGLDPVDCSGPPPSPEVLKARRAAEEAKAKQAEEMPAQSAKATRMSSLAAGIAPDLPEAPPGGNGEGGGAPTNVDVPFVEQAGSALSSTMGNWTGEPTSYSYAWQINGNAAGTDAATYNVQAGDVGGTATCTVTATNAAGSTTAPPSNSVTVA
jgi:hypothetical protein